jgi:hypothetical protein
VAALSFVIAVCGYTARLNWLVKRTWITLRLRTRLYTICSWLKTKVTDPNVLEIGFVGVGLAGIGAIFWPAALILCGILGVLACERSSQRRDERIIANRLLRQVA